MSYSKMQFQDWEFEYEGNITGIEVQEAASPNSRIINLE
jgi:hypothetical protein